MSTKGSFSCSTCTRTWQGRWPWFDELASYKKDKVWNFGRKKNRKRACMEFDESIATIESNDFLTLIIMKMEISLSPTRSQLEQTHCWRACQDQGKKKHRKQLNNFIAELEIPFPCYFIMNKKNKKESIIIIFGPQVIKPQNPERLMNFFKY